MLTQQVPTLTAQGALFAFSEDLAKRSTHLSRFEDVFHTSRIIGSGDQKMIMLPREACPMGEQDKRIPGTDVDFVSNFKPRDNEQAEFVASTYAFLHTGVSGIGQAPTGFGKTICACDVIAQVGKKTAVVVTKEDLKEQWIAAVKMVLSLKDKDIGIVQGDQCNTAGKKFVICMIQSVSKAGRYPSSAFRDFGLVIWDEVHRVGADMFSQSVWNFPALLRLGLSATPYRKDGKEILFFMHIGPVRAMAQQIPMIPKIIVEASGWSVPNTNIKTKTGWKTGPIPHKPGKTMHLSKMMGNDFTRNAKIALFVSKAYKKDRNIIVFADTLQHLENMLAASRTAGVPTKDMAYYVGGLSKAEREAAKVHRVLFSTYQFVSEGTDIPWLDTAVLGTPRSDVVQIVGRVLREYPDKKQPIVYDPRDGNSKVFHSYYVKRLKWYKSIGAEVKLVGSTS